MALGREISVTDWQWADPGGHLMKVLYRENRGQCVHDHLVNLRSALYWSEKWQLFYRIKDRKIREITLEDLLDLIDSTE